MSLANPLSKRAFTDPLGLFGKDKNNAAAIESAPIPTPASPVDGNADAVIQAEHDYANQNLLKKSVKKTILAGDTGGYGGTKPTGMAGMGV